LKILYFIESLGPGGKERRMVELICALVKNNNIECEVVLTQNEIHYKKILESGIKIHVLERKVKKDPSIFWKFYRIAKMFQPDFIHVWGNMVATYAIPAKLILKIPLINNQITDAPLHTQKNLNFKLNFFFSDKIIANTAVGLNKYNVDPKKSCVIYNGFDFDRIANLEQHEIIRKKLDISSAFVIGMVATFSKSKDYNTFINAAILVLKKRRDVCFLCIGSGNSVEFENMVPADYKKNILFLGAQSNVEAIMNICDIGVLASFGEGISNSLLEFMALGKPVIATNLGGTPELVSDGYNGYLIERSNPEILAEKIAHLLNNKATVTQMSEHNRLTVKDKFGIRKMENEFMKIYKMQIH
jgi:glycosyltransferase involved in cell wall biosynthesis